MNKHTLKTRLLVSFILLAVLPILMIFVYYMINMHNISQKQFVQSNQRILEHIMTRIELKLDQVNEFCIWIGNNESIHELLKRSESSLQVFDQTHYQAVTQLDQQFFYRPITRQMLSLSIVGTNGLYLCNASEASLIQRDTMRSLIDQTCSSSVCFGLIDNPARPTEDAKVVLYCRPLIEKETTVLLGHVVILFSERFFSEEYRTLLGDAGHALRIQTAEGDLINAYGQIPDPPIEVLEMEGVPGDFCYEMWLSSDALREQSYATFSSAVLIISILILAIVFFAMSLSSHLSYPIRQMAENVRRIGRGDFCNIETINSAGEIGELNAQMIKMGIDIRELMDERLKREKEAHLLEMKMLQSQINPHFLYNTLNSIRVMASMQGKNAIARMVEALGAMMRICLGNPAKMTTLHEELLLADKYVYIQNMRFHNMISYHCEEGGLDVERLHVLKFLIQPLLENAILHGFAVGNIGWEISVTLKAEAGVLCIQVKDNGSGIAKQDLARLQYRLQHPQEVSDQEQSIGLMNIQRRVQLFYGEQYGLHMQSTVNEGTVVQLFIPARYEEEKNDEADARVDRG